MILMFYGLPSPCLLLLLPGSWPTMRLLNVFDRICVIARLGL